MVALLANVACGCNAADTVTDNDDVLHESTKLAENNFCPCRMVDKNMSLLKILLF